MFCGQAANDFHYGCVLQDYNLHDGYEDTYFGGYEIEENGTDIMENYDSLFYTTEYPFLILEKIN